MRGASKNTIDCRGGDGVRAVRTVECLPGVQVISFERSTRDFSYYNDLYAIAILFSAEGAVTFRGREYAAASGQVGLIQPDGIFCRRLPPIPERVTKVLISPTAMENAARELGVPGGAVYFDRLLVESPPLFRHLAALDACLRRRSTALEVQTKFVTALELVIGESSRPPAAQADIGTRPVRRARDILHARFVQPIALSDLARDVGVSAFNLPRIFKREFGLPPHAYQNHLRLAQARKLLRQGMAPAEVAVEVGFTDQSHLTRHFRRTLGITPAAFQPKRHTTA